MTEAILIVEQTAINGRPVALRTRKPPSWWARFVRKLKRYLERMFYLSVGISCGWVIWG